MATKLGQLIANKREEELEKRQQKKSKFQTRITPAFNRFS